MRAEHGAAVDRAPGRTHKHCMIRARDIGVSTLPTRRLPAAAMTVMRRPLLAKPRPCCGFLLSNPPSCPDDRHQVRSESCDLPSARPPSPSCSSTARPARPVSRSAAGWRLSRALRCSSIAADKRKDEAARLAMMRAGRSRRAVPAGRGGEGSRGAGGLARAAMRPRSIDASTAHRVADGWVYGFPGDGCRPGRGHQAGEPRLQSGLLSDRRHRADPAAGGGRPDPRRLSRHGQRGERLQRRRAHDDRGLRAGDGTGLRALWSRARAQAPARAADLRQARRGGRFSCRRSATSGRACW